jgi:hypothetical protein
MSELSEVEKSFSNYSYDRCDVPFDLCEGRKFTRDLDYGSYPFTISNGNPIGYTFPGDKSAKYKAGNRFFEFKHARNKKKNYQPCYPRLHFWTRKWARQFVVCVDFDQLSTQNYRRVRMWGVSATEEHGHTHKVFRLGCIELAKEYQEKIGHHGFVYNSPKSGRPKILLLIEYPEPVKTPATKDIVNLFQKLFPEEMDNGYIDIERGAMSSTFFDWKQKELFADSLPQLVPIKIDKNTKETTFKTTNSEFKSTSDYKYYKASKIPKELRFKDSNKTFEEFLKCLCTMTGLVRNGFGISQIVLARTLEIDQPSCSRYIRKAIKLGILEVTHEQYIPGQRAKIYKAKGVLKRFLLSCIRNSSLVKIPKKIKDGTWHSTLLHVATTSFRSSLGRFIPWVKTLKGYDQGDRLYQAQTIVQWLIRRHPELASGL